MADEIRLVVRGTLNNTNLKDSFPNLGTIKIDQTNEEAVSDTLSLTTSETTVDLSSLTTPGYIFLQNLGATNTVLFGGDSSGQVKCGQVSPGKVALFEVGGSVTLKVKTDASTTELYFKAWAA